MGNQIDYSSRTLRAIATNGLPLKIKVEWTENDYYERRHPDLDEMECVTVKGWLVRINGKKYPRGNYDGEGKLDWTYRYTTPNYREAIKNALISARMEIC